MEYLTSSHSFDWDYAKETVSAIWAITNLQENAWVAEFDAGSGGFTQRLIGRAKHIVAMEPNPVLREIARHRLGHFPSYCSISGTPASTGWLAGTIDLAVSARSMNLVEADQLLNKYRHILRRNAWFALINNYHTNENLYSSINHFFSRNISTSFLSYTPLDQQLIQGFFGEKPSSRAVSSWQSAITYPQFNDRLRFAVKKTGSLIKQSDLEKRAMAAFELLEANRKITIQIFTEVFVGRI
jgi:hypothetical protein